MPLSTVHTLPFVGYAFVLPSSDYTQFSEPYNLAPQIGTFEVVKTADTKHGQVLRQTVLDDPIEWCSIINLVFPVTLGGDGNW